MRVLSGFALPTWSLWVALAFVLLGLIAAAILLFSTDKKEEDLSPEERVQMYAAGAASTPLSAEQRMGTATDDPFAASKAAAERILERNKSLEEKIALRLETAGSKMNTSEWLLAHLGIAVLVTLIGLLISGGSIGMGIFFLILGLVGPWIYLGIKRSRRIKAFERQLPDTLQLMSGSLSAGLSLAQSVDTIVNEGTEPMASEFRQVLVETRLGLPLEDAMEGIVERFDSKDFAWVVMAIKIQRQVGGNLAELLDTVAGTIRERDYMRRQVEALAAEGKISAYVLGGLPPLFGLYLFLTQPGYMNPMFESPLGWAMFAGVAVMLAVGAFWMSKLIKVEV